MYSDILCAVTLKDESVSDLIGSNQELDVSSLKDDADAKLSADEQKQEEAAQEARLAELDSIQQFLSVKKAKVAELEAKGIVPVEQKKPEATKKKSFKGTGRGRPRACFVKQVTFTKVNDDSYKLAGRGRPKAGVIRVTFELFHAHVAKLEENCVYSGEELRSLAKKQYYYGNNNFYDAVRYVVDFGRSGGEQCGSQHIFYPNVKYALLTLKEH